MYIARASITRSVLITITFALIAPAYAAPPSAQWKNTALQIVGTYEGEGYGQVTPDTDCQGLSLGIEQHTVAQGSALSIINAMAAADFDATVEKYLPTSKVVFLQMVELMRAGKNAEARMKSHELQDVKSGGACRNGTGMTIKAVPKSEIRAWLLSPEVTAAQRTAAEAKQEASFRIAECFLRSANRNEPLRFKHFVFIYGWYVQGGKGDLESKFLEKATANVIQNYKNYSITERKNIEFKTNYLADWLAVHWTNTKNPKFFADAEYNSKLLRTLAPTITETDIRLLYMRKIRASMGNIPFQLTFMNRGVIDLIGRGRVNSKLFDHKETFNTMGVATDADRESVSCAS